MPTSTVKLRQTDIVDVAKDLIRPSGWQCEWNISTSTNKPILCRTILTSWNAYFKSQSHDISAAHKSSPQHLIVHCKEYRKDHKSTYGCRLPRCSLASGISLLSYDELVKHIQLSHLNRSALQCPINGCNSVSFTRPTALENHFVDDHPTMLNKTILLPSPLLHPLWLPFYPGDLGVPSLPSPVLLGSVLVPPVRGSWRDRSSTPKNQDIGSRLYTSPRKPVRMDIGEPKPKPKPGEDTPDQPHDFEFDNLEPQMVQQNRQYVYRHTAAHEGVIRSTGPYFDLSRPQPQLDPAEYGHRVLPATILYDAWRSQHESEFIFSSDEDEQADGEDNSKALAIIPFDSSESNSTGGPL